MKTHLFLTVFMVGLVATMNAQIPTNGLVGSWPFNGNANDESGNGNNGTVSGASLTTDRFGNPNLAYSFDGENDYIAIAPSSLVDNETAATLSFWIKRDVNDDYGLPIHTGNQGCLNTQVKKDSVLVAVCTNSSYDGSAPTEFAVKWTYIQQSQWNHIILSYDGAAKNLKIYLNGILSKETFAEGNIWSPQSSYLAFGVYYLFGNPNHGYYKGILDDVMLYNRALSENEIKNIYTHNMCSDTIINDTTVYHVSDLSFEDLSPKVYLNSIDSLNTSVGGCDSIIYRYLKFVYEPDYFTDTIWVNDTIVTEVFDTTYVTITDTSFITVTDTLIIDVTITGVNSPENMNTLKVYPNPAKDYIYINTGNNYERMTDYKIKIISSSGSLIFETNVNQQLFEIKVNEFGQTGLFFIQIINNSNQIIDTRKIILE